MKTFAAIVVALILLLVVVASNRHVQGLILANFIPAAPDWPAPKLSLDGTEEGRLYYATRSPYDLEVILTDLSLAPATTGLGFLTYPKKASAEAPVPAMVIVPGSGGIAPGREHDYAAWFNARGIAAFVVDYYEPRGFPPGFNYFVKTAAVTEFDLIADAYAALTLLGSSPRIDAERIGLIGFSYGGMATRLAMDQRIKDALAPDVPPFALHIDTYGPCFQDLQSAAVTGAPVLTLRGTEDASNELPACLRREDELRQLGVEVTAKVYAGAGHAWENAAPRAMAESNPYLAGCELQYDDRGRAYYEGEPLVSYQLDEPLAVRAADRITSGLKLRDCVGYGYIVGRDEATRNQAYQDIEDFLAHYWPQIDKGG
ncbi:MAG: dienelactone hydrolase family protein [Pseudomonadota bacterium]